MNWRSTGARRSRNGKQVKNRINRPPVITFAMFELGNPSDCNARRRAWVHRRYSYRDITPVVNKRNKVPSFYSRGFRNNKGLALGKRVLSELKKTNADWYLLSGHHGRLYSSDWDQSKPLTEYYNKLKYAGFFNNDYHHGRWVEATQTSPKWNPDTNPDYSRSERKKMKEHLKYELYLGNTEKPPSTIAPFDMTNPFLEPSMKAKRQGKCKGFIISACNTLIYPSVRKTWHDYYPDSVFIGTFRRIGRGGWVTNAIYKSKYSNKAFWEDPATALSSERKCIDFTYELARHFKVKHFGLGIMYKSKVYVPFYDQAKRKIKIVPYDYDDEIY